MAHKSYILLALTLLSGILASIGAFLVAQKACDFWQGKLLAEAGREHVSQSATQLNDLLTNINDECAAFASKYQNPSKTEFQRFADQLTAFHEVFSIEWMPLVSPTERARFEAQLSREVGETINIVTHRDGRITSSATEEVCTPARFIHPFNELTKPHLARRRVDAALRLARRTSVMQITRPRTFYRGDQVRYGLYVPLVNAQQPVESDLPSIPFVLLTFNELFSDCTRGQSTVLTISDRTQLLSPSGSATTAITKDAATTLADESQEASAGEELHVVSSDANKFLAEQRIGGRLFRFNVSEADGANFRLKWVPWTAFAACNALALFGGIWLHRRESRLLIERTAHLQEEIERREASESRLQGMLDFREHERELIAHDIHDGFVQDVIGAQMYVESIVASFPNDSADRANVQLISEVLTKAIDDARQTIDYLKPRVVDEIGLVAALQASVRDDRKQYGFEIKFSAPEDFPRLPLLAERMLYRMVREAICNARQHSGEAEATVTVTHTDDAIVIKVSDEGQGFDLANVGSNCFGIAGIQHRAELLNGFAMFKSDDSGTKVRIQVSRDLPIPERPENQSLILTP